MKIKKANKKICLRKKKGNVFELVIIIIGILSLFIVLKVGMESAIEIDKYRKAGLICRNYMLKVESHGYLSQNNADKLESKLESMGFTDINLSGTTMSPVNNGDDIYLTVNLTQHVKRIKMNGLNVSLQQDTLNETIPLSSTAKN